MITCPNKNLPEWLELERVIPDMAYTIWDNNNGNGIDKAPNGEPSKLFSDLLEHFNGDRDATIQAKAKVYSTAFKSWFGDWLNPFSQIRGFNIIFGHPAIGKTTALQGKYKNRFIDWDVEYNEKRDRWIEEHTKTKKGTKEFKNARNLYLIYPENHPDYIEFLTEEWNRVKNKAKQEDKILLASPHTLLKLFPNDFNYIIDVESNDFISRNINRGGNETGSKLWKEGIDKTISNITNIPKYTIKQGIYLSDLLDKATNSNRVSLGKEIPNTDEYSKYGQKGETDVEVREVLDENDNIIGTVRMEFSGKGRKGVVTLHPNLTVTGKGYGTALYQHIADIYNINVEESFGEIGKSEAAKKLWNKIANTINKDPDIPLRQLTPSNSSKVVDENGEPLVVYHHSDKQLKEFMPDFDNYFVLKGGVRNAIFFTGTSQPASGTILDRPYKYPVFLSAKSIIKKSGTKAELSATGSNFTAVINKASTNNDAVIFSGIDDNQLDNQNIYVVFNPNQIKSIDNVGTFNKSNIIYEKSDDFHGISLEATIKRLSDILDIDNTSDLINYINGLLNVSEYTKLLLTKLLSKSTKVIIDLILNKIASYDGNLILYKNRLSYASNQILAEDIAHEMLHHYFSKLYDTNSKFRSEITDLRELFKTKLGKNADEWYAFLDGKESDEFLSEIMSNSQFRLALQLASTSLWDKIKALFTRIILGVKTSTKVSNITSEIYKLIDSINRDDINIYTNNLFNQLAKQKEEIVKDNIDDLLTKITKGLSQRLESIKRYNKRNIKNENELETLILDLSDKDGLQGTVEFIDHIHNSIDSSAKFLSKDLKDINYKQVRQLNEDYVGFYKPLLDLIKYNLDTTDMFKDLPELESFHNLVNQLSSEMNTINNKYNYVAKEKGILALVEKLKETNTPQHYIDNIILWIKNPNNDGNFFSVWTGMSSESSNLVVQTIAKILNDTKNNTDRYVYEEGLKLLDYLLKAKEVHGIKAQSFLYEKLNDGTYSGYMVRDINYGLYRSDFRNHLDNVAKKLKITLDKDGKYILPEDEDITDKWYESIEDFYSKNTERRYTNDYYTQRNKILSSKSKAALDEINSRIKSILDTVTEENLVMEDLLTKELQQKLENLRRSKKLLGLEYNLDGTPKQGIDAIISKEIRKFNTEVGIDNKYLPDYEKFKSDETKVIAKYGKDSKEHQTWVKNNTVTRYTLEFYDRIANLEKVELTKEYLDLYDKRRQLLSFYRNPNTLEVNVDELSDKDRHMLKQLDLDMADLFSFTDEDKTTDDNKDKFFNFAEITYTSQYYKDYKMALEAGGQAFLEWFNNNHYEDFKGKLKPAHYYTKLTPKREVVEAYTETVPSGRYSKLDPQSKYFNHNFIEGGSSVLPKRSIYDNTANYNKVLKDVHLKALYDAVHNSIMKSNSLLSFMSENDNYRMPQISAKTLLVISRSNGVLGALNYLLEDIATTKEDDTDYVEEFATKPNGEPLRMIPTRYIKMLKNTNNISTDAVASTLLYADMASNFYNMSQQRDLIETLLNLLKLASVTTKTEHKGIGSLNYYKQALLLIDRLMYGREKVSLTFNIGNKEINAGKVLDLTRAWVTKVNLSYNPWSAGTSTLTDLSYTTLEAFLGRYYTFDDINFAKTEFMSLLPYILSNVGNPKPNNKITYLMQLNLIVRDNREIYDRLDHSTAARALNLNFWFAGYTQSDYTVKGHVTVAIYHGYKYIKGEGFMNKNQYLNKYHSNDRKAGAIAFKQLPINLYDTYTQDKDGNFKVKDEYKLYVTEKLLNDVKNRIEVLTKRVDGTLRDVDKAKIHSNSITAYLSQHRNFMISALHNRLKGRMYNQDLGIEEEGYYRTMTRFLKNIIGNKHFALSQMLADYDNMEEYELYSVKKVLSELTMVASSTIVALTIAGLVDSDDDYDNWLLLATTYLALRSAFEFRSLYNPAELMSMIKSPTAAFSWFDHSLGILGIFNPFAYIYAKSTWSSIDRGVYKGLPKVMRNIIKITPAKNLMEMQDPKSKRNYLQNLLMTF